MRSGFRELFLWAFRVEGLVLGLRIRIRNSAWKIGFPGFGDGRV